MIEVKKIVDDANANMQKAIAHLEAELSKIRAAVLIQHAGRHSCRLLRNKNSA
jgi:ribosome recycling factor